MRRKVVVTGASSMVGISIIRHLIGESRQVLAITRRKTPELLEFEKTGMCKVVICDLEGISNFDTSEISKDYETFIHLAWAGTFGTDRHDEEKQVPNIKYTLDCVTLARYLGCHTFVGVGSQAEYGKVCGVIKHDTPTNPETPYGIAKLAANKMSKHLAQSLDMKHVWCRLFSVYGPHDNPNTMIMSSISNLLEGKTMSYTKATHYWNYLYVDDAARGIVLAGDLGDDGQVYCIANSIDMPLYNFIFRVRDIINPNIEIKLGEIPYGDADPINLQVDTEREEEELGFCANYSFSEGIEETIKWYKEQNK